MKKRRTKIRFYHGGAARGLWRGDIIEPNMAEHRYVKGCPCCEAQRQGLPSLDPPTPPDWVYATSDLEYARFYASLAVEGDVYEVELIDDVEPSVEDTFPSWRGRQARVVRVIERRVTLTMPERERLFLRWGDGGTPEEFDAMLRSLGVKPPKRPARVERS